MSSRSQFSTVTTLRAPKTKEKASNAEILAANEAATVLKTLPAVDVTAIRFSLVSSDDMRLMSVVKVENPATNPNVREPGTPHDGMLGVTSKNERCARCANFLGQCYGHYGYIELGTYLAPPEKYLETILRALIESICGGCGHPILSDVALKRIYDDIQLKGVEYRTEEIEEGTEVREVTQESNWRLELLKAIATESKSSKCSHIKEYDHGVDKDGNPIIDSLTTASDCFSTPGYVIGTYGTSKEASHVSLEFFDKALSMLTRSQLSYFGYTDMFGQTLVTHPKALIISTVMVIPIGSRPPTFADNVSKFNVITDYYNKLCTEAGKIKHINLQINRAKALGQNTLDLQKAKDDYIVSLSRIYDAFYKDAYSGVLAKKEGLIRQELQGKIITNMGRTTIIPDPTRRIGEMSIPLEAAQASTVRVAVTHGNIGAMNDLLREGKIAYVYPKTSNIENASIQVLPSNAAYITLQIGDEVDRQLQDGDFLMFIRQPSLSEASIISGKIRIWDRSAIGLPLEMTPATAADFDGDQFNYIVVQTAAGRNELESFLKPENVLISPKDSSTIYGAVQDGLVGSAIMTLNPLKRGDKVTDEKGWVTREMFDIYITLCSDTCNGEISKKGIEMGIKTKMEDFKRRLLVHDMDFSLLDENGDEVIPTDVLLSWVLPPYTYKNDLVSIRDGILISGVVNKATIGITHNTLIQNVAKDISRERAIELMGDLTRVCTSFLSYFGMSVGPKDCDPVGKEGQLVIGNLITDMTIQLQNVKPAENSKDVARYETEVENIVSEYSGRIGKFARTAITADNRLIKIIDSGAKGNNKQLEDIIGIIGQQYQQGNLPRKEYTGGTRYGPWFHEDDVEPTSMGMCTSNLAYGVTPAEAVYLASAARISFVNLGVTTSSVGEVARTLYRTMEELATNSTGAVIHKDKLVSSLYGGDGFDPTRLQRVKGKNGMELEFINVMSLSDQLNAENNYFRE